MFVDSVLVYFSQLHLLCNFKWARNVYKQRPSHICSMVNQEFTDLLVLFYTAITRGVAPHIFFAFGLQPACIKQLTRSLFPSSTATCNKVQPRWSVTSRLTLLSSWITRCTESFCFDCHTLSAKLLYSSVNTWSHFAKRFLACSMMVPF